MSNYHKTIFQIRIGSVERDLSLVTIINTIAVDFRGSDYSISKYIWF